MAKAGPQTNGENQGGYDSEASLLWGFAHMHDSGTGGVCSDLLYLYGNSLWLTVLGRLAGKFPNFHPSGLSR